VFIARYSSFVGSFRLICDAVYSLMCAVMLCLSVIHAGIVLKQLNLAGWGFHCRVAAVQGSPRTLVFSAVVEILPTCRIGCIEHIDFDVIRQHFYTAFNL